MGALRLKPALKQTIWGGERLKKIYDGEGMDNIAEAWLLSCHPDGESVVSGGELDGKTLSEALKALGDGALGENCKKYDGFPLLIKFIDAADKLSVQVHPDNEYAREHENENGKTEAWYILESEKDAELIFGVSKQMTREEFRECIVDNSLLGCVNHVKVKRGDVAFIPSGTLHGIGAGILLAEVQQSSNTTYRVYDYNRMQNGKPRQLHVDKAVDVTLTKPCPVDLSAAGTPVVSEGYTSLVLTQCEYFIMTELDVLSHAALSSTAESFVSLIALSGEAELIVGSEKLILHTGDSVFIPAGSGEFTICGKAQFLETRVR